MRFLEMLGFMFVFDRVSSGKVNLFHPKTSLGMLIGTFKAKYIAAEDESGHSCVIEVDGRIASSVEGCCNREEAVSAAAEAAIERINDGEFVLEGKEKVANT